MDATTTEILSLVREEDVKFIRLAYCDLYGIQKNMAIMASQLPRAFAQGIPFDASAAAGFSTPEHTDLFLVPDGSTVSILPWRPVHERVMRMMCDSKTPTATDFSELYPSTCSRPRSRGPPPAVVFVNVEHRSASSTCSKPTRPASRTDDPARPRRLRRYRPAG